MNQHTLNPASSTSNLVDRAANSAGRAVESTRHTANQALDSVAARIDNLREQAPLAMDHAAEQASALAYRGREALRDGSHQLRVKAAEASDHTALYIRNGPFKAVAYAAAAGAILALLAGWFGRSSGR